MVYCYLLFVYACLLIIMHAYVWSRVLVCMLLRLLSFVVGLVL